MDLYSFAAAIGIGLVHVLGGKLAFLDIIPRSRFLSAAGGISVAYVFIHLLPELSKGQEVFDQQLGESAFASLDHHAYLFALLGLVTLYGLEHMMRRHKARSTIDVTAQKKIFWVHVGSFAGYNMLVGYLVHGMAAQPPSTQLLWFTLAMIPHFFVTDYDLRHEHTHLYRRRGRWILMGAVLAGWLFGALTPYLALLSASLLSFLSGGIVLNVLKEELPEERESRYGSFLLGAALYTMILYIAI